MPLSLLLAVVVSAGAAAGVFFDPSIHGIARGLIATTVVFGFLMGARGYRVLALAFMLAALFASCFLMAAQALQHALNPPLRQLLEERLGGFAIEQIDTARHGDPILIEGHLVADATLTESGALLRLRIERAWIGPCPEPAAGGVSLTVTGALAADAAGEWRAGRTVRAPALLRRPARYLNHGVPDQERLLARRGIALVGSIKSAALVQVVARGSWVNETAASIRAGVRRAIDRHVGARDPQSAAVAEAILIGDRGSLGRDIEQRLQEAGTYHVIAISGGNIAIVAGLVLGSLWLLSIRGGWAAAGAIVLLAAYAHVAGGGPSVVRATMMAAIYLSLRMLDQRTAPVHAMALTAAVVLIATPLAIADVGLWLTFGATAAIVAGASRVALPSPWVLKVPAALLLASVCAEAVLVPIVAFVFQRVTIAGLVVNLAAIPCMTVAQVAAIATAAADAVHAWPIARAAGWITHIGVRGLVDSAALVDVAPWLTWRVPSPGLWLITAYYGALALSLVRAPRVGANFSSPVRMAAALLFLWIAAAPHTWARVFGDGRLHLTMMDVGQGDAMLVTLPNGRTLMIDAGGVSLRGDFDIGDRVIGPALRARGIGRLDYLALTHGDPDHIGGMASLVRDFAPAEVWDGVFVNNHEPTLALRASAAGRRAAWRSLQQGDRLELGGVELRVHHPPVPDWERQRVRNDDSLVMELRYGRVSILLTGDIGAEVERALIPALDLLPIVVLKSPHHGSGTSSSEELLRAVKPALVLISCGRGNPYGHPLPYVLQRYAAVGAQVVRTDQEGQIELTTDGLSVEVGTFTGRRTNATESRKHGTNQQVPRYSRAGRELRP